MPRFTLSPYIVRVKQHGTQDEYFDLDELPYGNDLLDVWANFLNLMRNRYIPDPEESDKILHLSEYQIDGRNIAGIIKTGERGIEADLFDTEVGEVTARRLKAQAEMYPFYFLIHIPAGSKFGIVVLQRFHNFGIRTMLFRDFAEYFKDQHPESTFVMNPLMETQVLREFMDVARLVEIKAVKYSVPSDFADEIPGLQEDEADLTMSLKVKRDGHFSWLVNRLNPFVRGEIDINELVSLKDFEPDTIKVVFDRNGSQRTFNLINPGRVAPYYDITGDVVLGDDGWPTFESVNQVANDHLGRFLEAGRQDN